MPISQKPNHLSLLEDLYAQPEGPALLTLASRQASWRAFLNDERRVTRLISVGIITLCVVGLGVGVLKVRAHVYGPLLNRLAAAQKVDNLTFEPSAPQDLLGLSKLDTDHDGLSDYDEQYVYHTSRYLEDSDSDGTSDKDEVAKGTDPLCAFERDCASARQQSAISPSTALGAFGNPLNVLNGTASPDQIRDLLVQSGASRQEVDQLTDAQLNQAYQEVLNEARQGLQDKVTGTASDGTATLAATSPQGSLDQLAQLSSSPDKLRDLLRQYGVDESTLSQVSDDQLLELAKQTLAEQSSGGTTASGSQPSGSVADSEPTSPDNTSPDSGQITGEQSILP